MKTMRAYSEIVLLAILFLFFFQLLTGFVESVYAFGLLITSIPPELVSILLLLSPALLLLWQKGLSGWPLVVGGTLVLVSRVLAFMLNTRGKMIVSGIGVACFLLFFLSFLWNQAARKDGAIGVKLGVGLTVALCLSILFRALNSGLDVTTVGWTQGIGWLLAVVAAIFMYSKGMIIDFADQSNLYHPLPTSQGKITGLSIGIISVFILLYFAFTSPNVIARWTEANYLFILSLMMLVLSLFAYLLTSKTQLMSYLTANTIWIWNALFVVGLVSTIVAHQIQFPVDPSAYPLGEPSVTLWHHLSLLLLLLLFPVVLIDFMLLTEELMALKPAPRPLAGGFVVASAFLLFMIFAQVFTTVYDYIPVVGPFFRDKFWLVFLLAGLGLTLPLLLVRAEIFNLSISLSASQLPTTFAGFVFLTGLVAVSGAILIGARPAVPAEVKPTLKILTYNIQQGYSVDGQKNIDGQLAVMREINADVIGLSETDTNRISGGNDDIVRYFADKLNMYSYYGPKVVQGTFGIALLSKYPISNPRTFYMYSLGEQTATIEAQITAGETTFNLFVTHLGSGGPLVQQKALLAETEGKSNVILMGDFNFQPDTQVDRVTTTVLDDAWLLKYVDDEVCNPLSRIDYFFVSPSMAIADVQYLESPASDHPPVIIEIQLNGNDGGES